MRPLRERARSALRGLQWRRNDCLHELRWEGMHDAIHRGEVGVQDGVEYGGDCARRYERGVSEAADGEAGVPVGAWDIVERRMQGWRLEEGEPFFDPEVNAAVERLLERAREVGKRRECDVDGDAV